MVPPEVISGRLIGAGFAFAAPAWLMAWVERTTAVTAGSIPAGVLYVQPGKGHPTASMMVGDNWNHRCGFSPGSSICSTRRRTVTV